MTYWDYYDEHFDWDDEGSLTRPDLALSRQKLQQAGLSETQAHRCVEAGYVYEQQSGNIIDRFYGGPLLSSDSRTRFRLQGFIGLDWSPGSAVQVLTASSFNQARAIVDRLATQSSRRLLFRGQTEHYQVHRELHNPYLTHSALGEISLIPSLWRVMLKRRPLSYTWFEGPYPIEWSLMLDSFFDKADIERRMRLIAGDDVAFYNLFDFEECNDPIVKHYAKCQLDLTMGMNFNLADLLATLLQHYGLLSPVLDLTSSLEVALFFATHQFARTNTSCSYQFIGTNNRRAVLYILRDEAGEMAAYQSKERIIQAMFPLRPARQHCEICKSSPYAINLPADFVVAVIQLDFDTTRSHSKITTADLFPAETEDSFLRALQSSRMARRYLTNFAAA